jgi:ketosteroid isomerase-like protein
MFFKIFCIAACLLALRPIAAAQGNRNSPAALDALVETERRFSQTSERKGTSASFLEFFEAGGLAFVPAPHAVEEVFGDAETAKRLLRYRLVWQPVYGDVAAAEDLGYVTGVSERTDLQNPSAPARYGAFFSVWRRQPDGSWKVMLDCGARTPRPVAALNAAFTPSRNRGGGRRFYQTGETEIADLERELHRDWRRKGAVKAYLKFLNRASRLHRMDRMPLVGARAVREDLGSPSRNIEFDLIKTGISKSGDLGFAYGNYAAAAEKSTTAPNENGVFFRVWQRDARGRWKIVVDVMKSSSE